MGDKDDLTRIEDLSEFFHEDDPEVEAALTLSTDDLEDEMPPLPDSEEFELEETELSFDDQNDDLDSNNENIEQDELEVGLDYDSNDHFKDNSEEDEGSLEFSNPEELADEIVEDTPEEFEDGSTFGEEEIPEDPEDSETPIIPDTLEVQEISDPALKINLGEIESPEPVREAAVAMTNTPTAYKERENFQDLRNFGNNLTYGSISTQANPPYSVLIEDISKRDQADYFINVMREHGLVNDSNESDFINSMNYGRLLISQISEYSAIYLAHKFRKYPVKITLGLADDIHSSANYEDEGQGMVSGLNINQNNFDHQDFQPDKEAHIVMSTSLSLENYFIEQYLDILTVEKTISEDEFLNEDDNILQSEYYQPLIGRLKDKARNIGANGVVGIDFQHTYLENKGSYKILCTGNAVHLQNKD